MGFFDIFKKKKEETTTLITTNSDNKSEVNSSDQLIEVVIGELSEINFDEGNLVEIKDKKVLSRISLLVPSVDNASVNVGNIVNNVKNSSKKLYEVVLKNGGELVNSRTMAGAKRAMTRGANGIIENANLIPVSSNGSKATTLANVGAGVMSVASMVVGQYYMTQIDNKIQLLTSGISSIKNFLDIEYKSQVITLLESVYSISKYQISSLENNELREQEIDNLIQLRIKCLELLNASEMHIQNELNNNSKDYKEYTSTLKSIEKWYKFQTVLIQLLDQISMLDFTLNLGYKPQEHCFDVLETHKNKFESTRSNLLSWNKTQCEILKIDVDNKRRKHSGILALLEKPISLINNEWNYIKVEDETISMIKSQTNNEIDIKQLSNNAFEEEVKIIVKDGKYYYQHN